MDERIQRYFQGELSQPERLALLKHVEADDALKKQFVDFQNMHALLNLSEHAEGSEEARYGYERFIRQNRNRKMFKLIRRVAGYAAAIAVLVISSCLVTANSLEADPMKNRTNSLYAPAGQRARLTLQDGTAVWLNAQSTLTYPSCFDGKERRVVVEGEAFFEVAEDKERPFIVSTQGVELKVMGTKFNVFSYPGTDIVRTSLIEGKVKVYYADDESRGVILNPNEQVVSQRGMMTVGAIEHADYFLWKDGIYCFEKEKLSSIIKKLELYYDVKILLEESLNLEFEYTGKFRQRDGIDEILRIIQKIQRFTIEKDKENNIITLKKLTRRSIK